MAKKDDQPRMRHCPTCGRRGYVYTKRARLRNGKMVTEEVMEVCKTCGGAGVVPA